jgi:CDGSH-type Zn-finger protein
MSDVKITIKDNGPLLVSGAFSCCDADGGAFSTEADIIALCRCGHSANKPFCDGAHSKEGFAAADRAR